VNTETTIIFLKWWDAMALMYEKYGPGDHVEGTPEWRRMVALQDEWVERLRRHTGSDARLVFEKTQTAIENVLGKTAPVALTPQAAEEVLQAAVKLVLETEANVARMKGAVN
jgi:hypothetical protein